MNKELIDLQEHKRQLKQSKFVAANTGFIVPKLKVEDPLKLQDKPIPERRWQVKGYIPHGSVTMLNGDGGVGKSLVALQLLTCAAMGKDWLGQKTMPCRALGIFCEDDQDELHRRQAAINEHYGISFADLENLQWLSRVGEDNALMIFEKWEQPGAASEFFQQIHNAAQDFGAQLIVLDALHDMFSGNENSRPQARQFIQLLASLAKDCEGTVVLCAHPSVAGMATGTGVSGSTAWNNAVRSRMYLTRPRGDEGEEDQDKRVLKKMKANYSGRGDEIELRWVDGAFHVETPLYGAVANIERQRAERIFLACLDVVGFQGRTVCDVRNSSRYAPRVFSEMNEAEGIKLRGFEKAMQALFSASQIRVGTTRGADRHPISAIVRCVREVCGKGAGSETANAGSLS